MVPSGLRRGPRHLERCRVTLNISSPPRGAAGARGRLFAEHDGRGPTGGSRGQATQSPARVRPGRRRAVSGASATPLHTPAPAPGSPPSLPLVPCFLTSHSEYIRMECKEVWSCAGAPSASCTSGAQCPLPAARCHITQCIAIPVLCLQTSRPVSPAPLPGRGVIYARRKSPNVIRYI